MYNNGRVQYVDLDKGTVEDLCHAVLAFSLVPCLIYSDPLNSIYRVQCSDHVVSRAGNSDYSGVLLRGQCGQLRLI